jgi:hypothetical protein
MKKLKKIISSTSYVFTITASLVVIFSDFETKIIERKTLSLGNLLLYLLLILVLGFGWYVFGKLFAFKKMLKIDGSVGNFHFKNPLLAHSYIYGTYIGIIFILSAAVNFTIKKINILLSKGVSVSSILNGFSETVDKVLWIGIVGLIIYLISVFIPQKKD